MTKKIVVVPYNPDWPKMYEAEAKILRASLGDNVVNVYHVGSTSVPELAAKPKLDIIAEVHDASLVIPPLDKAGYAYRGEYNIPFHRGFAKRHGQIPINLHLFEKGNPEIKLNLIFRDYLRSHPETRDEYGELKLRLVSQKELHKRVQGRFSGYSLAKDEFIKGVLAKADFKESCIRFCTHYDEWDAARDFRQKYFFDKANIKDPYTWTFNHDEHVHLVLHKGTDIIGYAHIQLWPDDRAAMRIIVVDEKFRGQGFGRTLLRQCERWLKSQGRKLLQVESNQDAYEFYRSQNYMEMPFNNPDGEPTHPNDIAMGKVL